MRRMALAWLLAFTGACSSPAAPKAPESSTTASLRVPELAGVPPLPVVEGDPVTPEKIALGTSLFFDKRLSGSGHTSCDSCHLARTHWQDNLSLPTPDRSYPYDSPTVARSTQSLQNIVYAKAVRWEGSQTDLVLAMAFPLAEPNMNIAKLDRGINTADVPAAQQALYVKITTQLTGYLPLYRAAFKEDVTSLAPKDLWTLTGRALRAFATQAVSRDAPFDRWNAGDDGAMSAAAVRGLAVFRGRGRCESCHSGPLFTDFAFHNISSAPPDKDGVRSDVGHFEVTGDAADQGKFLTPTLRGVYDTAPYFHDGSQQGLRDVIRHFASPAILADPNHDPMFNGPLPLSDGDIDDLIEFLKALRGAPEPTPVAPASFP